MQGGAQGFEGVLDLGNMGRGRQETWHEGSQQAPEHGRDGNQQGTNGQDE